MDPLAELIGESPAVGIVREKIQRLLQRQRHARRLPPILLQGETGTGKGLLAHAIHRASQRRDGPFVDVNCAAIPETLLEAEMFGFERGAFTDARQAKPGLFQAASGGSIFLDEVALLPEALQAKLLKVIEERTVRRLGATRSEPIDVWIITGTNEDLATAARERRFREDLYHRLAVLTIALPPLRARGDDVVRLAEHFLSRACADYDLPPKTLEASARRALLAYAWPGNVRELGNVMERVALLSEASEVSAAMLGIPEFGAARPSDTAVEEPVIALDETVEALERRHLLDALTATNWNVSRAAARLGLSRNAVRWRIEKHGLRRDAAPSPRRRGLAAAPSPVAAPTPAIAARPPESRPTPTAVRWERRRVTVLHAQVTPPPGLPTGSDLGRHLEVLLEKVQTFGGRVQDLSPTRLVAAFGLEPVEDAPRRAANAALAMRKAAERARAADPGRPWTVRISIHVVEAQVGRLGEAGVLDQDTKREAWAALDALIARAQPDEVVVSEAAAPFLERRFDFAAVEGQVSRLADHERTGLGVGGRMARFIGRQRELDLLRARYEAASSAQGQVVGIVGDAGIGKSRLLFEFRQAIQRQPMQYLEGHCLSYGNAIPYLPVLDLLRTICGIGEMDTPESITGKVGATLARYGMVIDAAAPCLLQLLGLKDPGGRLDTLAAEMIQTRTVEALRQLTLHASRAQPLVIVLEDLHWIDRTSEDYFASLVELLGGARILLVATYRPGYRPPWIDKSYATQMALQPLSPSDGADIVRSVVADPLPETIVEAILAKAEGNPFFLEEMARAVREHRGSPDELAVPDTIQELVLARIERLAGGPERLLQAASVLGRKFPLRLLRAIWDGPGDPEGHLRELARQEFLYEQSAGDETLFVFKHAMTQEVAYARLTEERRQRYHAAVGLAIWEQYAGRLDEVVELLAHHFSRSDLDDKAVDYAIQAAEKAQRRWANAEALAHFQAAVARLDRMPDTEANRVRRIDAIVKQAEVKFALGQHAEHVHALEGIRDLIDAVNDPRRRATWCYWTGFLHSLIGSRPEVAIAYCQEAVAIADAEGLEEIRAFAEFCLAQVYVVTGELRSALEAGEHALAVFESRGNIWWACRTLWLLSTAANAAGEWSRSLEYCRRALEHGRAVDDRRLNVVALWRMGSTHILRGDPDTGLQCCDEALALSPTPFDEAMVRAARGHALMKAGKVASGTADLKQALAWLERSHLRYTRSVFALRLAEGYLRHGERAGAQVIVEEVLATSRAAGYRHLEAVAARLLGQCLTPVDPHIAAGHLDNAVAMLNEMGARSELAKALVAQAELRRAGGDLVGARQLLDRARVIFEEIGTLDEPGRVQAVLASLNDGPTS